MENQASSSERRSDGELMHRGASVGPVDEKARTVRLVFSTGAPVMRRDWSTGQRYEERLEISDKAVRLDRLNAGAPVLNSHAQYTLSDQIGVVERAWIERGRAMAIVRISDRPEVEPIWQDIRSGVIRNVSVGYRVDEWAIERRTDQPEIRTAIDWTPYELSFVPVPADAGAQVRSLQGTMRMDDENDITTATGTGETAEQRGMRMERERASTIRANVRGAGLGEDLAEILVARGVSIESANAAIVERMRALHSEGGDTRSAYITVNDRAPAIDRIELMAQGLACRFGGLALADERARPYAVMGIADIARELAEVSGVRTTHMPRGDVLSRMMSTSDLPNLLLATGNRILRDAYMAATPVLKRVARRSSARDFRAKTHLSVSGFPELRKVPESAEYTYAGAVEAKESYAVATFGRIVSVTRQAIVNDDLDAFAQMQRGAGIAAAHLEAEQLVGLLTANAAMDDGTELFHADHNNLLTGGGSALAIAGLTAARTKMRLQKDLNGKLIAVAPSYLIVPAALEATALTLVSTNYVAAASSDINPHAGQLEVLVEPRLDAVSTTQWYLAASPTLVDGLEYAYLDGSEGPQTFTEEGFDVDGLKIKVRLDFGSGVIDWRGLNRSNGS